MTVVLVHGNPETAAIWGPLVDVLGREDVVRLSPPGFGAPLPDDFPATYLAYRDWLEAELEAIGDPVDLVGHDWGGGHVVNVVMHRPELVRSWASDIVGVFDADYVWHDMAQVWQTAGAGEKSSTPCSAEQLRSGPPSGRDWAYFRHRDFTRPRRKDRRWVGPSCCSTVRPANRRWPKPDAPWRRRRRNPGFRSWPPRTHMSDLSRSGGARPTGRGPHGSA